MKKILSMIMAVVLLVGLLPQGIGGSTAHAATGSFFIFPNESYDPTSPHVVGDSKVTITGSYNSVNATSIRYSVTRIYKSGSSYVEDTTNQTTGLSNYTTSNSSITVTDIPLYAGLNKVTFSGAASGGGSNVSESIYFEYHDGPTIYNLSALLDGNTTALSEDTPAILTASKSGTSYGQDTASISLTGFAPNATKVTVSVNGGSSRTATVSSSNNYSFTVAPLTINSGKNTLSIQASNGTQTLTTTREVTFYNGSTTFYDTYATNGSNKSTDLSNYPDFSIAPESDGTGKAGVTGKVVIPLTDGKVPTLTDYLTYTLSGGVTATGTITPTLVDNTTSYMTLSYTIPDTSGITFAQQVNVKLTASGGTITSPGLGFTLRNSTSPYIYKLNYLSGYSASTTSSQALSMTGTTLDGANIFSLPTAVEVLVANADSSTTVDLTGIVDSTGKSVTAGTWTTSQIATSSTVVSVNGTQQTMKRYLIQLSKIPVTGTMKLTFTATKGSETSTSSATVNILYGPYITYTKAYDGQVVSYGQNNSAVNQEVVVTGLDSFKGKLQNVADTSTIKYSGDGQTVFFYINNTLVPLQQVSGQGIENFQVVSYSDAYSAMFSGENTIKFVFKSSTTSYENTIKVNLVPTDIPVVPYNTTLGMFPFTYSSANDAVPTAKDATNFPMSGSNYTTKQSKFNVYGTFDFVDLGKTASAVSGNLGSINTPTNYKLVISDSTGATVATWTLNNQFGGMQSGVATSDAFNTSKSAVDSLSVYYEYSTQSFAFVLRNQSMPTDGSPIVYTFTVYNTGDGGPTATATMEIDPISATYEIVRPLTAQKTTNSNFVDVVINSKNASAVTINKETATVEQLDMDHDGTPEFEYAYHIRVKDLKANKETKIPITVKIGDNTTKDTVTVTYVPTNIPGAQYMQAMKNSAKVFNGDLQLKFPAGTSLIRRDADSTDDYSGEVLSGNTLLFAIANSNDGVVERYDIETAPVGVKALFSTVGKQYFVTNFNTHFVKASDVYWIDPGVADDATTTAYDPITEGQDPYQPATYTSSPVAKSYYLRASENELVPSKRGTITLSYLSDMAVDAGKTVTVLYFDPELKQWSNIGGVVNASKRTITVPFDRFGYYVVAKLSYSYNDIVQHSYARNYMEALYSKGIMKATDPDTAFGANQYITRGEFVTAIVKALEIPLNYNGTKHFIDVSTSLNSITDDSLYDFRYIETAARAGFVRGTQPQVFSAADNITRQDAAVIIASATNLKLETDNTKVDAGLQKIFKDYASIDRYARASVLAVAKKGYINGSAIDSTDTSKGYNFEPTAKMLRADTAAILARVMIGQKLLPKMS